MAGNSAHKWTNFRAKIGVTDARTLGRKNRGESRLSPGGRRRPVLSQTKSSNSAPLSLFASSGPINTPLATRKRLGRQRGIRAPASTLESIAARASPHVTWRRTARCGAYARRVRDGRRRRDDTDVYCRAWLARSRMVFGTSMRWRDTSARRSRCSCRRRTWMGKRLRRAAAEGDRIARGRARGGTSRWRRHSAWQPTRRRRLPRRPFPGRGLGVVPRQGRRQNRVRCAIPRGRPETIAEDALLLDSRCERA